MYLKRILASLTVLMSLSFSASAVQLVDLSDFPDWFTEPMARESDITKQSTLEIARFNVKQEVKGGLQLIESSDNYWYFNIDVGTDAPVECYVFTEFDGPANSLYNVVEASVQGAAELNNKPLSGSYNFAMDVGVIGDTPYLALDTLYTLGSEDQMVSGVLKGLSARTGESLEICIHNEIGYQQTFFSVFESFVQAFLVSEEDPEFFSPIYGMKLNGIPVGYVQEIYTTDSEGDIELINDSAFMFPVDASSITRSDARSLSWSRPDGLLINASQYSVENGVLASEFSISAPETSWVVTGQLQGKGVNATLEYDGWLLSTYGTYLETSNLGASDQVSSEFPMWVPEADPTTMLPVVISKVNDDLNANYQIDMGPIMMKFLADEQGVLQSGVMVQGPAQLDIELIYVKGEPALP